MFHLFRVLADRVKALFIANAALDFEGQFASRAAERKAELLREAQTYEQEGLPIVAQELRQRAEAIDIQKPLACVLPSLEHWQAHDQPARPLLTRKPRDQHHGDKRLLLSNTPKKKR